MNKTITVDVIEFIDKILTESVIRGRHSVNEEMFLESAIPKEQLEKMVKQELSSALAYEMLRNEKLAKELIKKTYDRDRAIIEYSAELIAIPIEDVRMLRKLINMAFETNYVPITGLSMNAND